MINVIKFSGEKEPYSEKKVYNSAKRAGASDSLARKAVDKITKETYDGIETSEILDKISFLLKEENQKIALRFGLKKAMKRLGPTGFPFEKYVCEIFRHQGYKSKSSLFLRGKCCSHEIDFIAESEDIFYIGECKYRNLREGKVHTKDALANYARFLDVKRGENSKSILVTNSKFTSKAIKYSKCVGVELLGWRYPRNGGLEKMIEEQKLYPVTILPSLKKNDLESLFEKEIMIIKDIFRKDLKLSQKAIGEARILLE